MYKPMAKDVGCLLNSMDAIEKIEKYVLTFSMCR
jgi:hypothetical protein